MTIQIPKVNQPQLQLNHVALIPDGNRRWARAKGLPDSAGHKAGVEKIIELARAARNLGIHTFTVWGLSTENLIGRSKVEQQVLMSLLDYVLRDFAKEADENETRIIHLGRKDIFPAETLKKLTYWEQKTKDHQKHIINIAFGYGGHDELLRAVEKIVTDIETQKLNVADLRTVVANHHAKYPIYKFADYLDTAHQPYPYPDLIIRSASESRLSGFMPWQSVYSELCPDPALFPDFTVEAFLSIIERYKNQTRKFGK